MGKNQASMKSQKAVSQTEGTTSAKILRQEGSQRGWNKITRMNGDARHQGSDCVDIMLVYPLTGDPRLWGSEWKLKKVTQMSLAKEREAEEATQGWHSLPELSAEATQNGPKNRVEKTRTMANSLSHGKNWNQEGWGRGNVYSKLWPSPNYSPFTLFLTLTSSVWSLCSNLSRPLVIMTCQWHLRFPHLWSKSHRN